MREEERAIARLSKYRVKIVERAGDKLERLLVQADPFEGKDCGREDCVICRNPENRKSCNRRSLVYKATCQLCEQQRREELREAEDRGETETTITTRIGEYIGESGRSMYRRGREQQDLWRRE